MRVLCQDGVCKGVQYMDADTGRILFTKSPEAAACVYELVGSAVSSHASHPQARLVLSIADDGVQERAS